MIPTAPMTTARMEIARLAPLSMSIMFLTMSKSDSELIVVRLSPYSSSMRFSTVSTSASLSTLI